MLEVRFEERFLTGSPGDTTGESYNPMRGSATEEGWH